MKGHGGCDIDVARALSTSQGLVTGLTAAPSELFSPFYSVQQLLASESSGRSSEDSNPTRVTETCVPVLAPHL